jgi:hypothetical protein
MPDKPMTKGGAGARSVREDARPVREDGPIR